MAAMPSRIGERARTESRVRRSWVAFAVVLAAAGPSSCRDFTHTNPFDSSTPIEVTIVGPDTLWNASDFAQYTFQSVPAISDSTARWVGGASDLRGDLSGGYLVYYPPLYPETEAINIVLEIGKYEGDKGHAFWRRAFGKTVIVTQRLVRLQLRCPDVHACDPLAVGEAWNVWLDGFDSTGNRPTGMVAPMDNPDTGAPLAQFVSRDTTIATVSPVGVRAATIAALKSGTTWVVASRGALRDSLQVTVR